MKSKELSELKELKIHHELTKKLYISNSKTFFKLLIIFLKKKR